MKKRWRKNIPPLKPFSRMRTLSGMLPGQPGRKSNSEPPPLTVPAGNKPQEYDSGAGIPVSGISGSPCLVAVMPEVGMQAGAQNVVMVTDDMLARTHDKRIGLLCNPNVFIGIRQ